MLSNSQEHSKIFYSNKTL